MTDNPKLFIHLAIECPGKDPFERLVTEELVIGRSQGADLSLADEALSLLHARVYRGDGGWRIGDLGSLSGTFVSGLLVRESSPLVPGDVIVLGNSTLRVLADDVRGKADPTTQSSITGGALFRPASDVFEKAEAARVQEEMGKVASTLQWYIERLRILNDVHQALAAPTDINEILHLVLDRAFDHLGPTQGAIFLREPDGSFRMAACRPPEIADLDLLYSQELLDEVAKRGQAALVMDARKDDRLASARDVLGAGIRSVIAAPLMDAKGTTGMIVLSSRLSTKHFSQQDMQLLVSLASAAALYIRNLSLAEEAAARRRLEEEVELARKIQMALLPEELPAIPGCSLYAFNLPHSGVSGDFYQIVGRRRGHEWVLWIADVSGKGIAASLLLASLEALAAAPIAESMEMHDICTRVSDLLYSRTPPEKYATAFFGAYEPATGFFRYSNAGHNPALLLRADGGAEWLFATGLPLGILPERGYHAQLRSLDPGDSLIMYTDGVTEARDPDGEEFGRERLLEVCSAHRGETPEALATALKEALSSFSSGAPPDDDCTFLMLKRDLPADVGPIL